MLCLCFELLSSSCLIQSISERICFSTSTLFKWCNQRKEKMGATLCSNSIKFPEFRRSDWQIFFSLQKSAATREDERFLSHFCSVFRTCLDKLLTQLQGRSAGQQLLMSEGEQAVYVLFSETHGQCGDKDFCFIDKTNNLLLFSQPQEKYSRIRARKDQSLGECDVKL